MGRQHPRSLDELLGITGRLRVTCRGCGHSVLYPTADIVRYFQAKGWSTLFAHAEVRFRCEGSAGSAGCGAKDAAFRAEPNDARPPTPPRPVAIAPDDRPSGSRRGRG